jgi:hypothetical protein
MVKQTKRSKTSSKAGQQPEIRGFITGDWNLPESVEMTEGTNLGLTGVVQDYAVSGSIGTTPVDCGGEQPHQAFANLPAAPSSEYADGPLVDPQAMQMFIRRYGPLGKVTDPARYVDYFERRSLGLAEELKSLPDRQIPPGFSESPSEHPNVDLINEQKKVLAKADHQSLLRYAWNTGDPLALEEIERQAMQSAVYSFSTPTGRLKITATNLWSLICILFLRDYGAGKIGVCLNPDCPVPYFTKKRRTQKICEEGDCVAWAQRQYAIKWWRENRAKKSGKKKVKK